jgi:hypothetical protein
MKNGNPEHSNPKDFPEMALQIFYKVVASQRPAYPRASIYMFGKEHSRANLKGIT